MTNEKNLSSSEGSAGKLGQLVFNLRLDAQFLLAYWSS